MKWKILKDLVSTPSGQLRLWGAILMGGAAFGSGFGVTVDSKLLLASFITGAIFIVLSIWMIMRK